MTMECVLLLDHEKNIRPEHLITNKRRKTTKRLSTNVFLELTQPDFKVLKDEFGESYVEFYGSWEHIVLPYDYFCGDNTFERNVLRKHVMNVLDSHVMVIIRSILSELVVHNTKYFSSILFWSYINLYLTGVATIDMEKIKACFSLGICDDELAPLFSEPNDSFECVYFSGYYGVSLLPDIKRYYFDAVNLASKDDFRVFGRTKNKEVIWFEDRTMLMSDLRKLIEENRLYNYAFHIEQNLNRMHAFRFVHHEDLERSMYYEIYRYWRDFTRTSDTGNSLLKRRSYCLGALCSNVLKVKLSMLSVCPPPVNFSSLNIVTYGTFKDYIENEVLYKLDFDEINLKDLLHPFFPLYDAGDVAESDYLGLRWKGVTLKFELYESREPNYNPYQYEGIPRGLMPINYVELVDGSNLVNLSNYRDFFMSQDQIFQVRELNVGGRVFRVGFPESKPLLSYRRSWYHARGLTKDLRFNGELITEKNLFDLFPFPTQSNYNVTVRLKCILAAIAKQKQNKRVVWNRSTLKLLSILNYMESKSVFGLAHGVDLLICGVIQEPLIELIKQTSPCTVLRVTAIGDQAVKPYDRTKLENLMYGRKSTVILSDIDQSSAKNEEEAASMLERQFRWYLNLEPECLVMKCQYSFGVILKRFAIKVKDVKLNEAKILFVANSGPLGIESYLFFNFKGERDKIFTLSDDRTIDFLKQMEFLGREKNPVVKEPRVISFPSTMDFRGVLDDPSLNVYVNVVSDNATYGPCLSAHANITNVVNVVPHGTKLQPQMLMYSKTNYSRIKLTCRSRDFTSIEDDIYNKLPRSFSEQTVKLPLSINQSQIMKADRLYNLTCKRMIEKRILTDEYLGNDTMPYLIDIGGRELEGIMYCPKYFEYVLVDKVNLPENINRFSITHHNDYINWRTLDPSLPVGGVVTVMFTTMSKLAGIEDLKKRVTFMIYLINKGYKVIFNFYCHLLSYKGRQKDLDDRMSKIKSIHLDGKGPDQQGTMGEYIPVEMLDFTLNFAQPLERMVDQYHITIEDVIETCYFLGIGINPELMYNLDIFNEFCPLLYSKVPERF